MGKDIAVQYQRCQLIRWSDILDSHDEKQFEALSEEIRQNQPDGVRADGGSSASDDSR